MPQTTIESPKSAICLLLSPTGRLIFPCRLSLRFVAVILGDPWLLPLCVSILAVLYFAIIPTEEEFLQKTFGGEYDTFCAAVPRLIPRVLPWPRAGIQNNDPNDQYH